MFFILDESGNLEDSLYFLFFIRFNSRVLNFIFIGIGIFLVFRYFGCFYRRGIREVFCRFCCRNLEVGVIGLIMIFMLLFIKIMFYLVFFVLGFFRFYF